MVEFSRPFLRLLTKTHVRLALIHGDRSSRRAIVQLCTANLGYALTILEPNAGVDDVRRARPDILLLDGQLRDTLAVCGELHRDNGIGVIFVDVPRGSSFAAEALSAGGRGLVFEDEPVDDVLRAVRLVIRGGVWAPRTVLVEAMRRTKDVERERSRTAEEALLQRLSPREREVLLCAVSGLANKELAHRLSITEATVKVHLTHIFRKLGINGRVELAAAYYGMLPRSDSHVPPRPPLT
jgi:DNA-binding NarL/FixJ family response regulator